MSKKALLGLVVAVFIPVISYFIVKSASEDAIAMPGHFFYDSVITKMKDGKQVTDTVWHSVKNITLTNQLGSKVSLDSLKGKVIVADYFFTHCPSICPTLTRNMKKLQDGLKLQDDLKGTDTTFVQFISFSVDPERDSSTVLKKYGDLFGVNPDVWWLLTGDKKTIYDFALTELKLGLQDGEGVDSNFIHTQKIALLDKQHIVRGYYDGLDSASLSKLAKDIVFIMLEKDKNSKSELAELKSLWPIFIIVLLATAAVVFFLTRKPKDINI
ncbi:MAG: SCO family protein [Bacteroidetes bacterium]|nr:SCO family protein [Bacteroidota bacterium]MBS1932566.1 SCO family protein [Bacteroidota bacterium]